MYQIYVAGTDVPAGFIRVRFNDNVTGVANTLLVPIGTTVEQVYQAQMLQAGIPTTKGQHNKTLRRGPATTQDPDGSEALQDYDHLTITIPKQAGA